MEKKALEYKAREVRRGQIFGLIIGLVTFLTTIISLYLGYETTATILGSSTVIGLVTIFITGRKYEQKK